mgnify:CR=1 FL=1
MALLEESGCLALMCISAFYCGLTMLPIAAGPVLICTSMAISLLMLNKTLREEIASVVSALSLFAGLGSLADLFLHVILTCLGAIGHGLAVLANGILTGLVMIVHGLAVLGNWLLPGLGMIGHGLAVLGNWLLTGLGMIGHGLAVLGNWLLTGLGMIGHGLAVMGSWIVTNTVTLANLFYTSAAAHPVITISIPLLVLASPLIISSYREFFNSKGAYKVNGDGQSSSLGSGEFSQKQDNFPADDANKNRTDNSAQPASWLFSYLGF